MYHDPLQPSKEVSHPNQLKPSWLTSYCHESFYKCIDTYRCSKTDCHWQKKIQNTNRKTNQATRRSSTRTSWNHPPGLAAVACLAFYTSAVSHLTIYYLNVVLQNTKIQKYKSHDWFGSSRCWAGWFSYQNEQRALVSRPIKTLVTNLLISVMSRKGNSFGLPRSVIMQINYWRNIELISYQVMFIFILVPTRPE